LDALGVEHAADLAVFAFVEGEFEPRFFFAGAEEAGLLGAEDFTAFGFDAAFEGVEEVGVGEGGDLDVVGFVEVGGGVGDAGAPFGIVGEEEEAFAGFVEAADGSEPGQVERKDGVDGVAAFFVGCGGD